MDCSPPGSSLLGIFQARILECTGPGEVDGVGPAFYDTEHEVGRFWGKPPHPRPRLVQLYQCKNVRMRDTTFKDSPGWTMWLIECEDVALDSIRVMGNQMGRASCRERV